MPQRNLYRSLRPNAITLLVILTAALLIQAVPRVRAASLMGERYDLTSNSEISGTGTHIIGMTFKNLTDPLGSVELEFCSNDPIPNSPCVVPSGFDISGATLINQTGEVGFSIDASSTVNRILLTRTPVVPTSLSGSTYEFDPVISPDTAGTYYIRLKTFSSTDGTGTVLENGGIALSVNPGFNITAEVPPYITLCTAIVITGFDCSTATTFLIDLGEFSTTSTSRGSSELVVATNAGSGFTISISGTTLTSGINTIPANNIPTGPVPGTGQFGFNLRANTNPLIGADPAGSGTGVITADYNTPNLYKFVNGDALITSSTTSDYHKFTASYIANISSAQAAGIYATTMTYICLANF
jgi:hypothetical protein